MAAVFLFLIFGYQYLIETTITLRNKPNMRVTATATADPMMIFTEGTEEPDESKEGWGEAGMEGWSEAGMVAEVGVGGKGEREWERIEKELNKTR